MLPYKGAEFAKDQLPVTEKVIREIVTLPMYPELVDEDIEYMVENVADLLSELR
jgi:dTDP-4-amino-4,6-dideoxygalactose transaminase